MQNTTSSDATSESLGSPISFQPISFSEPTSHEEVYRGIETASSSVMALPHGFDAEFQPMSFVPSKISSGAASLCQAEPVSLIHLSPKQGFKPLDISITPVFDNEAEISLSAETVDGTPRFHEPALKVPAGPSFPDVCCNELNSFLVEDTDCFQVMKTLSGILSAYGDDVDFTVDADHRRIEGLLFLSHYSVTFQLNLWQQPAAKHTRCEFRRMSGDGLAAAKLWSQLRHRYHLSLHPELEQELEQQQADFIALDLNMDGLPPLDAMDATDEVKASEVAQTGLSQEEIDQFTLSLIENDCFLEDELSFLHQLIAGNEQRCVALLRHKAFMAQLTNHAMLNQDVCVLRLVLLVLEELAAVHSDDLLSATHSRFFQNAAQLLAAQRPLIQKHVVRLLAALSGAAGAWDMQLSVRQQLAESLNGHQQVGQIQLKLSMQ